MVARFDQLNPYGKAIRHLLKVENENFEGNDPSNPQRELTCVAISAKRYVLRSAAGIVQICDSDDVDGEKSDRDGQVVKRSEHGLGHLLSPFDPESEDPGAWIEEAWRFILDPAGTRPAWLDLPAVSRTQVSTPAILEAFRAMNAGKSYVDGVKPFNFLLTCYAHPVYGSADKVRLVAPYERDPKTWIRMCWYDVHTGQGHRVTTHGTGSEEMVRVRTYEEVLEDYRTHPEAKSVGPAGLPCERRVRGVLERRRVIPASLPTQVGKESNKLEERMTGGMEKEDEYLSQYQQSRCGCGCQQSVQGRKVYVGTAHRMRAYRSRRNQMEGLHGGQG